MAHRTLDLDAPINELLGNLKGQPAEQPKEPAKAEAPKKTAEPRAKAPKKEQPAQAPEGYKVNPQFIEKKTVRLQLVLKQSTSQALKEYCKANNVSVNDYVGTLIDKYLGE